MIEHRTIEMRMARSQRLERLLIRVADILGLLAGVCLTAFLLLFVYFAVFQ
jgi:hypothetical protein